MKTLWSVLLLSSTVLHHSQAFAAGSYTSRPKQFIDKSNVSIVKMAGLSNVKLIKGNFGDCKLSPDFDTKLMDKHNLKEIWLVYTDFTKAAGFNQEELNRKRVEELFKLFPWLKSDTSIQWQDIVINGIHSTDSAKVQYHGFVFVYRLPLAEPTLGRVLDRHRDWDSIIVVADVTTSMLPWLAEVMIWLDKNMDHVRIDRFVYFNDGDGMADSMKTLGNTGGVHSNTSRDHEQYIQCIRKYMVQGLGNNDIEENVLEALIEAQRHAGPGSQLILLADNFSTPRDTALIDSLHFPVKVIACGALRYDLNPALVNIAYRTKGSIHTGLTDIKDFKNGWKPSQSYPNLMLNKRSYYPDGRQMKCIDCVSGFN